MYDAFIFTHSFVVFGPSQSSLNFRVSSFSSSSSSRAKLDLSCGPPGPINNLLSWNVHNQSKNVVCIRTTNNFCMESVNQGESNGGWIQRWLSSLCHLIIIWSVSMTSWEIIRTSKLLLKRFQVVCREILASRSHV